MSKIHRCFRVLFLIVFVLSLVPMNLLKIKISAETQDDYYLDSEISSLTCSEVEAIKQGTRRLTYADFYAKGDGVTNDYASIKAAHDFANIIYLEENILLTVYGVGTTGNTFYMSYGSDCKPNNSGMAYPGKYDPEVDILTNVDWLGANFILDDYVEGIDGDNNVYNMVHEAESIFRLASKMTVYSRLKWETRGLSYLTINIETIKNTLINQNTKSIPQILSLVKENSYYNDYDFIKNIFIESRYWGVVLADNHMQFIRSGTNANSGSRQQDLLVMNSETGELIYPPQWEYTDLYSIVVFPINNDKITIKNGNFKTLTNNKVYKSTNTKNNCIKRNIKVNYSGNFLIKDISHSLDEEAHAGISWYPNQNESTSGNNYYIENYRNSNYYSGFIEITRSVFIEISNVALTPHTTPRLFSKTSNSKYKAIGYIGTYDFSLNLASCIFIDGLTYYSDPEKSDEENYNASMKDDMKWGIMGSNKTSYVFFKNSKLNRIDAHEGVYNLFVENTIVGNKGLTLIGGGTFYSNNLTVDGARVMLGLRTDYGSSFNGNVIMKNTIFKTKNLDAENQDSNPIVVINSGNKQNHDYGYKSYFPNVYIDGLDIIAEENNINLSLIGLSDVPTTIDKSDENLNPNILYYFRENIIFKNLKVNGDNVNTYLFLNGFIDEIKNISKSYFGGENKVNIFFDIIDKNNEAIYPSDLIDDNQLNYNKLNFEDAKFEIVEDEPYFNFEDEVENLYELYETSYHLYDVYNGVDQGGTDDSGNTDPSENPTGNDQTDGENAGNSDNKLKAMQEGEIVLIVTGAVVLTICAVSAIVSIKSKKRRNK